jgi:surfeit locus 1 family protein
MAPDYPSRDEPGRPEDEPGSPSGPARARGLGPVAAFLVMAVVVGVTSSLGAWQLARAHLKEALQAEAQSRAAMPPLVATSLARTAAEAQAQAGRRITLQGRWLPEFTVFLDNRTMDGRTGFDVVTPLRTGPTDTVIVQRGWVERDRVDPRRVPPFVTPAGDVTVQGRVAPPPSHWVQLGPDAPGRIRQNLDLPALQHESGAIQRPLVVVEDDAAGDAGASNDGLARHCGPRPPSPSRATTATPRSGSR